MRSALGIAFATALVALWSNGCGSSSSPAGGNGGGTIDAGTSGGSIDAGAGSGAGTPDAGGGGLPGADAGAGGGGGGPGSVDAGAGGGTGGFAGGGTGGADAGGGGGVAAGCEGVVPDSLGSSFTFDVPFSLPKGDWTCDSDTSDESGNIASRVTYGTTYASEQWHLFDSNGAHQAGFYALGLFPQGSGFEGISESGSGEVPLFKVSRWAPDGKRTDGPDVGGEMVPIAVRAWPNGLVTVLASCRRPTWEQEDFVVRRFDADLNEVARATASFACVAFAGAVEDANRNKLLLVSGTGAASLGFAADDLIGIWFDSSGTALTGWFRVGPGGATTHQSLVHALIGGGAAVRIDGAWTYFIPSGKAEAQPAPAFLAENGGADFTLVRGARAYAVLPRSGDRTQMKLYSTSGDLCGTVKFPAGGLTTGADGSVIASTGDHGCTKTVWPALLR